MSYLQGSPFLALLTPVPRLKVTRSRVNQKAHPHPPALQKPILSLLDHLAAKVIEDQDQPCGSCITVVSPTALSDERRLFSSALALLPAFDYPCGHAAPAAHHPLIHITCCSDSGDDHDATMSRPSFVSVLHCVRDGRRVGAGNVALWSAS